jgi:uncharacterized DUF497 family protein
MFEWDRDNLRMIRAHRIKREETEQALLNGQDADEKLRVVYCGETNAGRLLAAIVTERRERLRVVTACDLDAGQRRDCLRKRAQGK